MGKYCVKLMCGRLWSHHSSLINLRLVSLGDKCSPTSTSLTDISGAVPAYTSSTSAPTSLHNCSWGVGFGVVFFFFLPTGKKKLWLSQINLRNATEIDNIMISLWLLLIFATVHILSPSNSTLLSELGYLIHSQYKRQEKELYKNIKHAASLGPNLIYSHSRWSNNVQIRFMQ